MVLLGIKVAKDGKKKPPGQAEEASPSDQGVRQEPVSSTEMANDDQDEIEKFDTHLLVSLDFKLRLDQIAHRVNADRKRRRLKPRPLGWFVVKGLDGWLTQMEAELKLERPKS